MAGRRKLRSKMNQSNLMEFEKEVSANWGKWDKKTNTRYNFNFAVAEDTPEFQRYEDMSLAALIAESKRLLQHHVALNDYRDNY